MTTTTTDAADAADAAPRARSADAAPARSAAARARSGALPTVPDASTDPPSRMLRMLREAWDSVMGDLDAATARSEEILADAADGLDAATGRAVDELLTAEMRAELDALEATRGDCRDGLESLARRIGDHRALIEDRDRSRARRPPLILDPHPAARATVGDYLAAAVTGAPLGGAPAELNAELGLPAHGVGGGVVIPAAVVARTQPGRARVADAPELAGLDAAGRARAVDEIAATGRAVTVAGATVGGDVTATLAGRVWAPSIVDRIGVTTLPMPWGTAELDVLAAGSAPAWQAEAPAAGYDPAAATISTTKLPMVRLTAGYDLSLELATRLSAMADRAGIQDTLAADMMAATADAVHATVVAGSGTAPTPEGIWGAAPPASEPADPAKASTAADVTGLYEAAYDGIYAAAAGDVVLVTSPAAAGRLRTLGWDSGSGVSVADWAARNWGGVVASPHVAVDTAGGDKVANGFFALGPTLRELDSVLAMWDGMELIVDRDTDTRRGVVRLTMHTGANFAVLRPGAYTRAAKIRY